jgi:hypothetical protein
MTDLMSESQAAAEPCNGDPANDALSVDRLDDEKTADAGQGRHTISAGS